jgi:hypothetical protein
MTVQACWRCVQSDRVCLGYQESDGLLFRHHVPVPSSEDVPASNWAWSPDVDDAYLEKQALEIFLDGYVVEAADRRISRGFLDGFRWRTRDLHQISLVPPPLYPW